MPVTVSQITLDETVSLLAKSDFELIAGEFKGDLYKPLGDALAHLVASLATPSAASWSSILRLWQIYKEAKEQIQRRGGSVVARVFSAAGGAGICDKIDYCRKKGQLKELFEFAKSDEGTALFAKGSEEVLKSEHAKDVEELAKTINDIAGEIAAKTTEIAGEVAEEAADAVIPVSYIFMSLKYGFDELCKCCPECKATGFVKGRQCKKCKGTGHTRAHNDA
jgi:hypothetical protein